MLVGFSFGFSQEKESTKMDQFLSKTGQIIKYIDYNLIEIQSSFESSENRIRKLISTGGEISYFYQIEKHTKYSTVTASVEYKDLLEVIKATDMLIKSFPDDKSMKSDYMQNQFISTDGFKIGYYISKSDSSWFIKLDKYSSDNTLYFKDISKVRENLTLAKDKIEQLMNVK